MFSGIGVPQRDSDPEYDSNLNAIDDEEQAFLAEQDRFNQDNDNDAMEVEEEYELDQMSEPHAYIASQIMKAITSYSVL